jgi:ElaB/YqjD/DUF883 family membrane-anchored ribosome-binding protein
MTKLQNEVATAKTWATAHVIIAIGIAFAVGVIVGAVL